MPNFTTQIHSSASDIYSNMTACFFYLPLNCPAQAPDQLFHSQCWQFQDPKHPEKPLALLIAKMCRKTSSFLPSSQSSSVWSNETPYPSTRSNAKILILLLIRLFPRRQFDVWIPIFQSENFEFVGKSAWAFETFAQSPGLRILVARKNKFAEIPWMRHRSCHFCFACVLSSLFYYWKTTQKSMTARASRTPEFFFAQQAL